MIKLVKELLSLRDQILKHLKDIYVEYNGKIEYNWLYLMEKKAKVKGAVWWAIGFIESSSRVLKLVELFGEREEIINEVKESLKFGHEVRQKLLEYKKNRFNNTNNKKKKG